MNLKLDHVAIAVRSLTGVVPLLERLTGQKGSRPERVESQGVDVCFVGDVELVEPFVEDNGVARFLERRGTSLHHVAYRVQDVQEVMDALEADGYEFTSEGPMVGAGGHRMAFLHPRSTGGILIELVEKTEQRYRPEADTAGSAAETGAP